MTAEPEADRKDGLPPIVITDDMRLWGLAAAHAYQNPNYKELSDTVRALIAYQDAHKAVPLSENERDLIRYLFTNGRLRELCVGSGNPEDAEKREA